MRTLLMSLFIFFVLSGCDNHTETQSQRDARIAKEAKAELLAELKAEEKAKKKEREAREKNSTLFKIGIYQEGDTITIDTNKTSNFFKDLSQQITREMKKFSDEMEKGIEVDENHIQIDLNKTGNILDKWHQKMQNFANEINAISKSLEQNKTQEQEY